MNLKRLISPESAANAGGYVQLFERQRAAHAQPETQHPAQKISRLQALKSALKRYEDRLMEALLLDIGKQKFESVFMEIGAIYADIDLKIIYLQEGMKIKNVPAAGVTLIAGSTHYPVFMQLSPLVLAIAAGNPCILLSSEMTPSVSALLAQLINDTFEPAEAAVFMGGGETLAGMLQLPFSHIFYTGSYQLAKMVFTAAAENLSAVDVALTGQPPVIIHQSSDLEHCATQIIQNKFTNAGQHTAAPDYIFVHEEQKDALVALLMLKTRVFYKEHTYTLNMDAYAAITSAENFERLRFLLHDAVKQGAAIVMGGTIHAKGLIFHPTILTDVPAACALLKQEIFGPILPVLSYQNLDEVMSFIAAGDRRLSLFPYSQHPDGMFPVQVSQKSFRTV